MWERYLPWPGVHTLDWGGGSYLGLRGGGTYLGWVERGTYLELGEREYLLWTGGEGTNLGLGRGVPTLDWGGGRYQPWTAEGGYLP